MPGIVNATHKSLPLYTPLRSIEEGHSNSNLKATVVEFNEGIQSPSLHRRSIEQVSASYNPCLKATILGTMVLLGTAGMYYARQFFAGGSQIQEDALFQTAHPEPDMSHRMISERAMPVAVPLENQIVLPGASFQISHEFFTEAEGGFIQQQVIQSPSWLKNQLNPTESRYVTPRFAYGVQIVGNIAYVAEGTSGLTILNITTPSNPILIGVYDTSGEARGIQVVGTTAYVADWTCGLQIINVATPSKPTFIGYYNKTTGTANAVQIVGSTAYVIDENSGLQIINITKPSSPTLIGSYKSGSGSGVQIVGTTAYVAGSGLTIINITTPSNPTLIGNFYTLTVTIYGFSVQEWFYAVQVIGTTAYVAGQNGGLTIINIAAPNTPTLIGSFRSGGIATGIQVVGINAYVTISESGGLIQRGYLTIFNIAAPSNPTPILTYQTVGPANGVHVVSSTAYVATSGSLGKSSGSLQMLWNLNQLTFSGTSNALDRGSSYLVALAGTTAAGTTFTFFNLIVGNIVAPVYQTPISTQKAAVDESFYYIMPSNTFVDANGNAMTYKVRDMPPWLHFDAGSRTFSGKPTSSDTGTFADQSTIVTVIANDGKFETAGQFTVTVSGDSYLAKFFKVAGPTFTALGTVYSGYKNRALFLNLLANRKWKNNHRCAKLGENFVYALKTNAKDVRKVQAYVRDEGFWGKLTERILCGKKRHIELASGLPMSMRYSAEINSLYSTRQLEEMDLMGHRNMQIRVLGSGGVVKEILHLELEGAPLILDDRFDSLTRQERVGLLLFPATLTNSIEMEDIGNDSIIRCSE